MRPRSMTGHIVIRYHSRRSARGAALVELAIVLGFLVMTLFVSIQIAYFIDATNTLSQVSYQIARYAASHARDNTPTVDEADQDYTDPNQDSVLYQAYNICNNESLIPYGTGSVAGSTNTYSTVKANGATITIEYDNQTTGTTEGTAATRNVGDTVTVTVTYNLGNHMFLPAGFPVVSAMATNISRVSHLVIVN
jgi:Flp pilus assembly protein TadG